MSKKSKRLQQRKDRLIFPQRIEQGIIQAREQMLRGDFAGAINTCEPLLDILPKRMLLRVEVLALLGLAHGMLQHYPQSYDIFTEALTLDPTNAELWYNHGLACRYTTRVGQSVRDFERAVALLGTEKGDLAQKFSRELKLVRKEAQETMELLGEHFTMDLLIEHEEHFQRGLKMMKSSKWKEAEQAFRQVLENSDRLPQYWGNLGVCLLMQLRYDEAEEALKRALEVDPHYALARENLEKLPEVKQAGGPLGIQVRDPYQEDDVNQSITFYKPDEGGSPKTYHTIEKTGSTIKNIRTQIGKQPPRHRFFLNPYRDERFTTCPRCENKTRLRKFTLLIHLDPYQPLVLDKTCRYCYHCDLIIAHQDQVEERLAAFFSTFNPDMIGNDYLVIGTLDPGMHNQQPVQETLEHLHDFKEVITFKPVGGWRKD